MNPRTTTFWSSLGCFARALLSVSVAGVPGSAWGRSDSPGIAASASYTLVHDALDGGGRASAAGDYRQEGGLATWSGSSGNPATGTALRTGFVGQITDPPITGADSVGRLAGASAKFSVAALLSNDLDAAGFGLEFASVDARSSAGGRLVREGPWILYFPPEDFGGSDGFSYRIADGFGLQGVGSVTVAVEPTDVSQPAPIIGHQMLPNGHFAIRFLGIAAFTYRIEASRDLRNWSPLGSVTADSVGRYGVEDPAAGEWEARYYRSLWP